ncbi:unnamed protein product [Blepharisma stoltei]|uniref:Uncharacterized protein n=1 Tax=Blepharisma stoltei TaxID=1481888 RepID=A0AAU9JSI4_9CILI|nr:unnamed protein product [Blepharisma stoltei]
MELHIWGRLGTFQVKNKSIVIQYAVKSLSATHSSLYLLTTEGNLLQTEIRGDSISLLQIPIRIKPIQISCGREHCAFVTDSNEIYTWGNGEWGALGLGLTQSQNFPTKVNLSNDFYIDKISCGGWHTIAIGRTKTGHSFLMVTGRGNEGQLGNGRSSRELSFTRVEISNNIKEVSCGINHSAVIGEFGNIYMTGDNRFGQLGLGHKRSCYTFQRIESLEMANKVACGHHSAAICRGKLYVWGTGTFGEYLEPNILNCSENIVDITLGECSGAAITENGNLWTWGSNNHGELGTRNLDNHSYLTQVNVDSEIKIFLMGSSFLAIISKKNNKIVRESIINEAEKGKVNLRLSNAAQSRQFSLDSLYLSPKASLECIDQSFISKNALQSINNASNLLGSPIINNLQTEEIALLQKKNSMLIETISGLKSEHSQQINQLKESYQEIIEKLIIENKSLKEENIYLKEFIEKSQKNTNNFEKKYQEQPQNNRYLNLKKERNDIIKGEMTFYNSLEQNLAKKAKEYEDQSVLSSLEFKEALKSLPMTPFKIASLDHSMSDYSQRSSSNNVLISNRFHLKLESPRSNDNSALTSSRISKTTPRVSLVYKKGFEDIKNKVKELKKNRMVLKNQMKQYEKIFQPN